MLIRMFPKIMVPPNHPFGHRVFPLFSPSILGALSPIFGFTPIMLRIHDSLVTFVCKVELLLHNSPSPEEVQLLRRAQEAVAGGSCCRSGGVGTP